MPRTHSRDHFYKFHTLATARIIIERLSLRWSSPLHFNDPFDTQTALVADIDPKAFADRMVFHQEQLLYGEEIPAFCDPNETLHAAALLLRQHREKFSREKALSSLREATEEVAANLPLHLDELSRVTTAHMCHGRVYCLAEEINNVVMWSHYGDEHRGVGFRFRVLEDIDHPFLIARKVEYSDHYISLGNSVELADHFMKVKEIDLTELAWKMVYRKHLHWSYENEWRCYFPMLDQPAGDGYTVHEQDPRLFEAVYLGCRMEERDKVDFIEFVRANLPDTKIFTASKSRRSFDLIFQEV